MTSNLNNYYNTYINTPVDHEMTFFLQKILSSDNISKNINYISEYNLYEIAEFKASDFILKLLYSDHLIENAYDSLVHYYKVHNTYTFISNIVGFDKYHLVASINLDSTERARAQGVDIYKFKISADSLSQILCIEQKVKDSSFLNVLSKKGIISSHEADGFLLCDSNIGHKQIEQYGNRVLLDYRIFENPDSRINQHFNRKILFEPYYLKLDSYKSILMRFIENPDDFTALSALPLILQLPLISASLSDTDFGAAIFHGNLKNVKSQKTYPNNLNNALRDLCYLYSYFHLGRKFNLMTYDIGILTYGNFLQTCLSNPKQLIEFNMNFCRKNKLNYEISTLSRIDPISKDLIIILNLLDTQFLFKKPQD